MDLAAAPRRSRPSPVPLAAVVAALALGGCSDRGREQASAAPADVRRYTVRGEVVQLPPPSAGPRAIAVRHEAIDDFVDASGSTVGMGAMRMTFELAPAVPLEGVSVGDKVELRLAVGWSPPLLRVESLRKLPADTPLEFRAARSAAPPGGDRPQR